MDLSNNALTTLNTIKEELGIALIDTTQDNFIIRKINAISQSIENYCNRKFVKADYDELYTVVNSDKVFTNQYPLNEVTGFYIYDTEIQTADYTNDTLKITYKNTIPTKYDIVGISEYPNNFFNNVRVVYNAGYVLPKDEVLPDNPRTLPYDLEEVCIQAVIREYNKKGTGNVTIIQEKVSKVSYTYGTDISNKFTDNEINVLNQYRKIVI